MRFKNIQIYVTVKNGKKSPLEIYLNFFRAFVADNKELVFNWDDGLDSFTIYGDQGMSAFLPSITSIELESEDYSVEKDIKKILQQPLVDILVALMLINDIFMNLRHEF